MSIRLAIADDHVMYRGGFALSLDAIKNVELVVSVSNGQELLEHLKTQEVDVVFLDISMPVMDGFTTAKQLNMQYPHIKIIILSSYTDIGHIKRMIACNISGYISKVANTATIKKAIKVVCKKGYYYDKEVYHKIQENLNSISQGTTYFTERELSIIKLFAMQYSAKQIADILCCSTRTVEKHKEILLEKTASFSFIGVLMYALSNGYLLLEEIK
ncbi:response regulator transcription factor [Myroides sp. WP-1]|uniref:response regulator transcription factor n=1 Tax=Myroides sp. WP-1 TaxID=2759944 RepID=UPI0015F78B59|nr:response regulator transcription factor [Myroides sp. WP-1]MBB1137969.1 response regulator transcription factor [Myroides sp. WP-1]